MSEQERIEAEHELLEWHRRYPRVGYIRALALMEITWLTARDERLAKAENAREVESEAVS